MKTFTPDVNFTAYPDGEKVAFRKGAAVELPDDLADLYVRKGLGLAKRTPKPKAVEVAPDDVGGADVVHSADVVSAEPESL